VHPTAIPGADKLRLISESARGEGGRVWVPKDPKEQRRGRDVPEKDRDYFLEEKYPGYGNLVPRDIASRELFLKCFHQGAGVYNAKSGKNENEVYLDLTHLPKEALHKKLAGILEIYEKFVGEDPYENPMRVFPAVHYSMGGLWVDFERAPDGGLVKGSPRNQSTNLEGLYACGEVDYQYHGANRLGANSLLSCIFSGLIVAPSLQSWMKSIPGGTAAEQGSGLFDSARKKQQQAHDALLRRTGGGENPYLLHQQLGQVMTRAATVVRHNDALREAYEQVSELAVRAEKCSLSDTGSWTNQNVVFTKALRDMFPLAKAIVLGALQRDECRGAHYKPEFAMPGLDAVDPAEHRRQAEVWCDRFEENTRKWLKTTVAVCSPAGDPQLSYESVDTSLLPPRPRLYGLVGGELIEEVWKQRQAARQPARQGNGSAGTPASEAAAAS